MAHSIYKIDEKTCPKCNGSGVMYDPEPLIKGTAPIERIPKPKTCAYCNGKGFINVYSK